MGNNTTGLDQGRVVEALQSLYEEAYVDGQNAPNGYSCSQKRDEAVAAAMVSACEPGHAIAGRVIINVEGAKAISFGDEQWATLQVGDVIYSAGLGAGLGRGEPVAWLWTHENGLRVVTLGGSPPFYEGRGSFTKTPLYARVDPGEVERLRASLESATHNVNEMQDQFEACKADNDTLRAQLAERDALLRHLYDNNELSLGDDQRILDALSASAEPSAPVEIPVISGPALAEITTIIDEAFTAGQNGPYYAEDCINWVDRILEQVGKRRDD